MKIDSINYQILDFIIKFKGISLWQIIKKINWDCVYPSMEKEEKRFLEKKYMLAKTRLYGMKKEGILKIEKIKDGLKIIVDENKVIKKRVNFPDGNKERLFIKTKDCWVGY